MAKGGMKKRAAQPRPTRPAPNPKWSPRANSSEDEEDYSPWKQIAKQAHNQRSSPDSSDEESPGRHSTRSSLSPRRAGRNLETLFGPPLEPDVGAALGTEGGFQPGNVETLSDYSMLEEAWEDATKADASTENMAAEAETTEDVGTGTEIDLATPAQEVILPSRLSVSPASAVVTE